MRRYAPTIALCAVLGSGCFRLGFQPSPDAERRDQAGSDRLVRDATGERGDHGVDAPASDGPRPDRPASSDLTQDLPPRDQASDLSKPKDLPQKDLAKDLPRKDLAKDLAKQKDLPKPPAPDVKIDSRPAEATGFNPNGTYTLSPQATYTCAFGIVNFTIGQVTLVDNQSTLTAILGPTGPAGGCNVLTGDTAYDKSFSATCVYAGSCNETYTLSGTFSGTSFTGTFTASFSGSCLNCVNQSWPITGTRQ